MTHLFRNHFIDISKQSDRELLSIVGGLVILVGFIGLFLYMAVGIDRWERGLIASGVCTKVTEALYTQAPSARTTCYGGGKEGAPKSCYTSIDTPEPYMRSLWRCREVLEKSDGIRPERVRVVEFWRRTAEEFE